MSFLTPPLHPGYLKTFTTPRRTSQCLVGQVLPTDMSLAHKAFYFTLFLKGCIYLLDREQKQGE